jgi:hypothetical protein
MSRSSPSSFSSPPPLSPSVAVLGKIPEAAGSRTGFAELMYRVFIVGEITYIIKERRL